MSRQFSKASLSCIGFVGECLGIPPCLGEPHPSKARLKSTQRPVTLVYGSRLGNLTGHEPRLAPRHLLESLGPSGCLSSGRRWCCWLHKRLWRGGEFRLSFQRAPSTYKGLRWLLFLIIACRPPPPHIHLLLVMLRVLKDVSSTHSRVCTRGSPLEARPVPAQRSPAPGQLAVRALR